MAGGAIKSVIKSIVGSSDEFGHLTGKEISAAAKALRGGESMPTRDAIVSHLRSNYGSKTAATEYRSAQAAVSESEYAKYSQVSNADNSLEAVSAHEQSIKEAAQAQKITEGAGMQGGYIEDATASSGRRVNKFEGTARRRKVSQPAAEEVAPAAAPKSSERKILEAGLNATRGKRYQVKGEQESLSAAYDAIKSEVGRAEVGKQYGLKNYKSMTEDEMANAVFDHHSKNIQKGPSLMDKIYGNDVHKIAAGGALVTAGVVSAMSASRGQQTNAQLYGQSPRPGM